VSGRTTSSGPSSRASVERNLRRRWLADDGNVEISGRDFDRVLDGGDADRPGASQFDPFRTSDSAYELHPRSPAVRMWLHVLARSRKREIIWELSNKGAILETIGTKSGERD